MERLTKTLLVAFAGLLVAAGMSMPAAASPAEATVVYRCATPSGQVEFTTTPRVGCVVAATARPRNPARVPARPPSATPRRGASSAGVEPPSASPVESAPAGASAQCRDGTFSFSRSRRGTCSHHGGVARWL